MRYLVGEIIYIANRIPAVDYGFAVITMWTIPNVEVRYDLNDEIYLSDRVYCEEKIKHGHFGWWVVGIYLPEVEITYGITHELPLPTWRFRRETRIDWKKEGF